jgi:hypothetical protein
MLTHAQTLKQQLSESIERHGLEEVLDRLAELVHTSRYANSDQIVYRLEESIELALAQADTKPLELEPPAPLPLVS